MQAEESIEYKNKKIIKVKHEQLGEIYIINGGNMIHPTLEIAKRWIDMNEKVNKTYLFGDI